MINFLTEQVNNDVWEKLFSFVVTTMMIVFDLMMEIKIPLTNVSLFYVLIFTMVVDLSIYAIHGTSTNYNDLGSTVKSGVSNIYSVTARGVSDTKQGLQKHIKERKQFKVSRNKQQLSSLAKQAKTREQAYRRINK